MLQRPLAVCWKPDVRAIWNRTEVHENDSLPQPILQPPWPTSRQRNSHARRASVSILETEPPTALADHEAAINWADAQKRVLGTYRQWIRAVRLPSVFIPQLSDLRPRWILRGWWADDVAFQAPEIQTMYNVPFPVSVIRTRIREEFERNRFVNKLPVVDVLLFKSDTEYQVK